MNKTSKKYIYPATLLADYYKVSHKQQYPLKTQYVFASWIPRTSRLEGVNHVVAFGFQSFIKEYLIDYFNENFFNRPKQEIVDEYSRIIKHTLFVDKPDTIHLEALHDLGYLPIKIMALPEGTLCPLRVPMLTIENTKPEFFWLTNYLETLMSQSLWMPSTSATIALEYKKILNRYALETVGNTDFVKFQGHDFSMRGMGGLESCVLSGMGHLLSFVGSDTIPAVFGAEKFYNADVEKELVACSVPASEHAVMCSYGRDEFNSYKRILTEVYPSGIVSIVSDTWDLFKVLTNVIAKLKPEILARDGKCVIRPDSGDPVKIICGDKDSINELERKGVIEILWDIFGGTVSDQGYKVLDSHIGCIYGDAITLDRCKSICEGLKEKGFASINTVYGIGSFTYQHNTRDTFGFALKSTHVIINGEEIMIYKDPMTDKGGVKKSLKGRCVVKKNTETGELYVVDELNKKECDDNTDNELRCIFLDGKLIIDDTFEQIRNRLK